VKDSFAAIPVRWGPQPGVTEINSLADTQVIVESPGLNLRGNWSPTAAYYPGDAVFYNGNMYQCIGDVPENTGGLDAVWLPQVPSGGYAQPASVLAASGVPMSFVVPATNYQDYAEDQPIPQYPNGYFPAGVYVIQMVLSTAGSLNYDITANFENLGSDQIDVGGLVNVYNASSTLLSGAGIGQFQSSSSTSVTVSGTFGGSTAPYGFAASTNYYLACITPPVFNANSYVGNFQSTWTFTITNNTGVLSTPPGNPPPSQDNRWTAAAY
jgi:hypothetical protein